MKINKIIAYTQGINVTKNIILNDEDILDNTYQYISYKDKIFKLDSRNPLRQKKITYKCINKYKKKDKPDYLKYFCDSTIVAIRDSESIKKFKYYFNANHTECCNKYYEKINTNDEKKEHNIINTELKENTENEKSFNDKEYKNNITESSLKNDNLNKPDTKTNGNHNNLHNNFENNNDNSKEKIKKSQNNEELILQEFESDGKDEILNIKEFDDKLKLLFMANKSYILKQKDYIKYGMILYKKFNCNKYFNLPEYHLKNLYQKHKKEINPINLSELFSYSKEIKDLGEFARGYEETFLYNQNNEKFEHKHIYFYSNFDFKRLYASEHISIDGTYVFPTGFCQTLIMLYYDPIIYKFIPGVYILINNKTEAGYSNVFKKINNDFDNYRRINNIKLNWKTFTSDFEKSLIILLK